MTEEAKTHFSLYKLLNFPLGIFVATPFWFGIIKVVAEVLSNISFSTTSGDVVGVPWWCSWALFAIGEIAIFLFLAIYSYTLPKGKKTGHNIFILISPEYFKDDKYITDDFVKNFEYHAKGSIGDLNIVVPTAIKRETFNRTVLHYQQKQKRYWESNRWNRLHKRLKGSLYISGTLKRRSSGGKEKFVFNLSATIGYNNVNKEITPVMIDELQKNFPQRILINKEFELEEFEAMSDRFATFSEYLIGWAHLVGGNINLAYTMHADIYANKKQSFFKRGALEDLTQLLHIEIATILADCKKYPKEFLSTCVKAAEQLFPGSDTATLMVARAMIMTCTDDSEFDPIISRAQILVNKAKINSKNRDSVHANRAYVFLLKGKYQKAETEYQAFFKKTNPEKIEEIIGYCEEQIKNGCSKERPTSYYVRALMLMHSKGNGRNTEKAIEEARMNIPTGDEYYHKKLDEIASTF